MQGASKFSWGIADLPVDIRPVERRNKGQFHAGKSRPDREYEGVPVVQGGKSEQEA
jgi:hypothetical protein